MIDERADGGIFFHKKFGVPNILWFVKIILRTVVYLYSY
jgi:hypothetical protein